MLKSSPGSLVTVIDFIECDVDIPNFCLGPVCFCFSSLGHSENMHFWLQSSKIIKPRGHSTDTNRTRSAPFRQKRRLGTPPASRNCPESTEPARQDRRCRLYNGKGCARRATRRNSSGIPVTRSAGGRRPLGGQGNRVPAMGKTAWPW